MAAEPLEARQILRNAAAYMLLVGLVEMAGLPDGLFVALAAMTVMEVNLGDGLKQGRQRVLATLVGTAVVVMVLGGLHLGGAPGAALAFLMLRLLIFRFALEGGLVVGGHVLAGSFGSHVGSWGAYVFWRSLMTLVGVLAGLVLARNVLPRRNRELWLKELRQWLREMAAELRHCARALEKAAAGGDAEAGARDREALRIRRDALERRAAASLPEAETPRIAALWRLRQEDQLFHGVALLRHVQDLRPLVPALAGAPCLGGSEGAMARAMAEVVDAAAGRIEALAAQPEPGTVPAAELPAAVSGLLAAAAAAGGAPSPAELELVQRVRLVGLHTLALSGNEQPLPAPQAPGREAHQRSIR